jgi:succinate-semialdehyde dehydrogenase/glutarate-semialdehyde dehydrogenase
MQAINPATEEVLADYPELDRREVGRRLERAERAFAAWRTATFDERADKMRRLAGLLREQRDKWAGLMTDEMGKTIASAESEVEKCAWVCDFYAEHAEAYLEPDEVKSDAARSLVRYDPLGPVLAIMPWNFPFWQVFRFAVPAIMAGNVGLLKHASNVSGCALGIEELFREAGFPEGVFSTLLVPSSMIDELIAEPAIRAVTLTGSESAGQAVGAAAGGQIKKVVLELGGSDPFIVLEDADIERAARSAARARTINAGQSCIAAKRFIVVEQVAEAFEAAFVTAVEELKVGDPLDRENDLGPLAREDLLDALRDQLRRSLDAGAKLETGGERLDGKGYYFAPTVLSQVAPEMPVFQEETFGPLAAVTRARDAAEAIELANRSRFGLGASLWTGDRERGERLATDIEAGMVFVNGVVKSDPRLPFGGVKHSGHGRELSEFGIREFVNVKTVWIG